MLSSSPQGQYFVIDPGWWSGGGFPRFEIANEDRLFTPGTCIIEPPNGDPDQYPERPAEFDRDLLSPLGRLPPPPEFSFYFVISNVNEMVDATLNSPGAIGVDFSETSIVRPIIGIGCPPP